MGIEATGHAQWFEHLLLEFGHELWWGDVAKIRAAVVRKTPTLSAVLRASPLVEAVKKRLG